MRRRAWEEARVEPLEESVVCGEESVLCGEEPREESVLGPMERQAESNGEAG